MFVLGNVCVWVRVGFLRVFCSGHYSKYCFRYTFLSKTRAVDSNKQQECVAKQCFVYSKYIWVGWLDQNTCRRRAFKYSVKWVYSFSLFVSFSRISNYFSSISFFLADVHF